MSLDVTTPGSPGALMQMMARELAAELPRLQELERYSLGKPKIVIGSQRLETAYHRFQNMARSNFAELIVTARTDRMSVRSVRTAAAADDNGDQQAWRMLQANGLIVGLTDLWVHMGTYGGGYMAVGQSVDPDGEPVMTVENPMQTITMQDPLRPWKSLVGFKLYHDPAAQMDYAVLWVPGAKWVAQRPRKARVVPAVAGAGRGGGGTQFAPVSFSVSAFTLLPVGATTVDGEQVWADEQPDNVVPLLDGYTGITSERYATQDVPLVRFGNRKGMGLFEAHTDLLDRIAHVTLQSMVIATLQAFKQRAIEVSPDGGDDGGLPDEDEHGNPIDYNQVFEADPGALWRLPIGAKIWESGQVDMTGILGAGKDWILQLGTVTKTAFPMFSPDSANQSANGASLYREGLTFSVEDMTRIAGFGLAQCIGLGFQFKGDTTRSDPADIIIDWAPADRYSILEMAQADAQSSLPLQQKAARFYGMSPAEVKITMAQAAQQALMQAALAPKPPIPASPVGPLPAGDAAPTQPPGSDGDTAG